MTSRTLRDWLDDPAPEPLVVPTSGSTGDPKHVLLSRRAVLASVEATAQRLGGHGSWVRALPTSGIAGLMVMIRSLVAGHDAVELTGSWTDAVDALPPGRRHTSLVPTQLVRVLGSSQEEALRQFDAVLLGGASADPALVERAREAGIRIVRTYGMTETCGGCVYDGVPLDGVEIRIVDGQVEVAGPVLFDGYRDEPFEGEWWRTSDVGVLRAGRLTVTGRADDVIVSGGLNVPAPAVAEKIRSVPGVTEAEVLGVPDDEWGERVVAFVIGDVTLDDLRDAVVPRTWAPRQLVTLDAIPHLPSGKVDRVRLRESAL